MTHHGLGTLVYRCLIRGIILSYSLKNLIFFYYLTEIVSGFKQEEQKAGPDSGTGRHWRQVPGKPDHGQGQIQGSVDTNLRPG